MSLYPHMNLLKKNEQRYQGAVSKKMVISLVTLVPVLFLLLFLGIEWLQYNVASDSLAENEARWSELQPKLKVYNKKRAILNKNKKILMLISEWKKVVIPMSEVLEELQDSVPADIQLSELSITAQTKGKTFTEKTKEINYTLLLKGIAVGDQGKDSIVSFRKKFLEPKRIGSIFSDVTFTLDSAKEQKEGSKKDPVYDFSISARSGKETK